MVIIRQFPIANLICGDWNIWIISHSVGNVIIPTDENIFFQRGRVQTTNKMIVDDVVIFLIFSIKADITNQELLDYQRVAGSY